MQVWEKFDRTIDTKGLAQDVQAAAENSGEYEEVPFGNYEVQIEKLELVESKKGDPMVRVWFGIVAGEYKKFKLFYNQVIMQGFQIHKMNEFLRKLGTVRQIEFLSYTQYAKLLQQIYDDIYGKLEYGLEYSETKGKEGKSYTNYRITDIFELTHEKPEPKKAILEPADDDDIPF